MNCELWEQRLADGETGADIDEHLSKCTGCRTLAFDLRENSAALTSMRYDPLPTPRRRWPYVAASVAAAALLTIALWPRDPGFVMPALPRITVAPDPPAPKAPVRPAVAKPKPKPKPPAEPMLVKMLTDDPDVVIYWLIDNEGE